MAKKIIIKSRPKLKYYQIFSDVTEEMKYFDLAQAVIYDKFGYLTYRYWHYNLLPEFIHDWKLFLRSISASKEWYISDSEFEFILRHGDLFYIQAILEDAYEFAGLTGKAYEHYDNLMNILYIVGTRADDCEF